VIRVVEDFRKALIAQTAATSLFDGATISHDSSSARTTTSFTAVVTASRAANADVVVGCTVAGTIRIDSGGRQLGFASS
jgi:hypothetical protein